MGGRPSPPPSRKESQNMADIDRKQGLDEGAPEKKPEGTVAEKANTTAQKPADDTKKAADEPTTTTDAKRPHKRAEAPEKTRVRNSAITADSVIEKAQREPMASEQRERVRTGAITAGLVIVGAIAGGVIASVALPKAATSLTGATTVSEGQLSDAVGSYTLGGQTHEISARDALIAGGGLTTDAEDGSYEAPSAEDVLVVARQQAMVAKADERGITVSEDEISQYLSDTFGTDDAASVAEVYGYTEDEIRNLVIAAIKTQKLYVDVTGNEGGVGTAPDAPADELSEADAASYIIGVAGDNWNADEGAWADAESEMAKAVGDFDGESATQEQAEAAYQIAYQAWDTRMNEVIDTWDAFCDEAYKDVAVTIYSSNS